MRSLPAEMLGERYVKNFLIDTLFPCFSPANVQKQLECFLAIYASGNHELLEAELGELTWEESNREPYPNWWTKAEELKSLESRYGKVIKLGRGFQCVNIGKPVKIVRPFNANYSIGIKVKSLKIFQLV